MMSTTDVSNPKAQDDWVRNFEQYLQDNGRVTQETNSQRRGVLPAMSKVSSPAQADDGRFIDAVEDDIDFATEIENLLNTPPVLKRRMTANTSRTASSTPTYSTRSDSRMASSTVSLEYSRLQIASIINTQAFYDFNDNEAETGARRVSASSTATTKTTIRHTSLTSTIPEEPSANLPANGLQGNPGPIPVAGAFERQKPFSTAESLKPNVRSLQENVSPNEYAKPGHHMESHPSVAKEQHSSRPVNGTVVPAAATAGPSYGKYTPLILDFEEDIAKADEHAKPELTQPHPIVNQSSPQKHVSLPQTQNPVTVSGASEVKADPKWVKIQKHLIPRRAAPPPPSMDRSKNNKKPKMKKKKKNAKESDMFAGVIPKPYTSSRPKQNWFSKVLNGIL
ncbi:hypothetical protein V1509DRAFT_633642 [Lipomyces kononenkoae]